MPTNYSTWSAPQAYDFEYEDGKFVRLTPVEPEMLISSGALKFIDSLTNMVNEEHVAPAQSNKRIPQDHQPKQLARAEREAKQREAEQEAFAKMAENPDDFSKMMFVVDAVLCAGVIQPNIHSCYLADTTVELREKIPLEHRQDAWVYTDYIPFNDRMKIFGELTKGLGAQKSVPEGSGTDLGTLEADAVDEDPS